VYSSLLTKARNQNVTIYLCSGRRLAGKIIDFDDMFCEVLVRIDEKTGEFATVKAELNGDSNGWRDDRVLLNMSDISMIT
jgi:small nuclear ribonucleoprotein (snRNP)-like protein